MPAWRYDKIDLVGLPRKTSDIDILDDAGRDGWELVTIMPNGIAYLKRSILPEPPGRPSTKAAKR